MVLMWWKRAWDSVKTTRKKYYTIVIMSQQLREFVKQSGVEVSPSPASTTASNNNLIREIEADLGIQKPQTFPPKLEKNIMNNENYGEFAEFLNMSNENNNVVVAMVERNVKFVVSKLNPGMFNATVKK